MIIKEFVNNYHIFIKITKWNIIASIAFIMIIIFLAYKASTYTKHLCRIYSIGILLCIMILIKAGTTSYYLHQQYQGDISQIIQKYYHIDILEANQDKYLTLDLDKPYHGYENIQAKIVYQQDKKKHTGSLYLSKKNILIFDENNQQLPIYP